jgi:glucans biosynthesis protein
VVRDGIPAPVPFATNLFDYGRTKLDKPLPVNLGFAGFRLHYPLNSPVVLDELVSFLGSSYFRFLGRGQKYGLSARGLAIGIGARETEEFPFFREFWVEQPAANAERAVIYALLDGESVTGAYQFNIYPGVETTIDVTVQLNMRRSVAKLGVAPLTSMFLYGEVEPGRHEDYRPELHDSDGLQILSSTGERIWRPLRNPREAETSVFIEKDIRGFGLMQRDRIFEHYQDLDLHYEARPSYWVEPQGGWGEGRVELLEIPTTDESNDNIVATWVPKAPFDAGQTPTFRYKLRALLGSERLLPGGRALNTFRTSARALGSGEAPASGTTRFLIDFTGGDLAYYLPSPGLVEVVPTVTNGIVKRTFIVPNPQTGGFRAGLDIEIQPGQSTDVRAFLRTGPRALTETWTMPWKAD